MSFSKKVKKELSSIENLGRHCYLAELSAMISNSAKIDREGKYKSLIYQTENRDIAIKYFTLIKKTFNINIEILIRSNTGKNKSKTYILVIQGIDKVKRILQGTKIAYKPEEEDGTSEELGIPNSIIVQNNCCKRSFIRGSFLSSGSISEPEKAYHFEIVYSQVEKARQGKTILESFSIKSRIIRRKKYYILYIKEGTQIVDTLNVMGAHNALMEFENIRILKDVRNSVNRQVNCETANINKTVSAASRSIEDINYIKNTIGFGDLPETLKEIAILRVEYPEVSLAELGKKLSPPLGKSGVNHRLRRLCAIANQQRNKEE